MKAGRWRPPSWWARLARSPAAAMPDAPPDGPAFVPDYDRPDAPGVSVRPDNSVAIRHVVGPRDTFDEAATAVVALVAEAERRFPGWPRVFYLDVDGHDGDAAGFTPDLYELQQDFWFSAVAPFLTAFETPITGGLVNPAPQRDDVPQRLKIGADQRPHAGRVVPDHGA